MITTRQVAHVAFCSLALVASATLLAETAREGTKDRPFKLKCCDRPGATSSVDFLSGITPFNVSGPPDANVNTWSVKNSGWTGSGGGGAQWIQPGTLAQNYSEFGPHGDYIYRWFFEVPQCNKVGVPPIARQPFVVAGKIASDNAPAVKLDGTTVASSTDMYSFLPGHELTFTASVNPTVGVHALSFIVHNGGVIDTAAATAAGLNPAQIVAWQSMLNSGTDPTGMSARANISQACR